MLMFFNSDELSHEPDMVMAGDGYEVGERNLDLLAATGSILSEEEEVSQAVAENFVDIQAEQYQGGDVVSTTISKMRKAGALVIALVLGAGILAGVGIVNYMNKRKQNNI